MTRRRLVLISLVGLVGLAAALAPPASAAPERRFLYLATADSYTYTNVFRLAPTPAGEPAPFGSMHVTATGSSVTVHIDDFATPDGFTIPVDVWSAKRVLFEGCVPVRSTLTVKGATPTGRLGVLVGPTVLDGLISQARVDAKCSATGTGGVATITGVK